MKLALLIGVSVVLVGCGCKASHSAPFTVPAHWETTWENYPERKQVTTFVSERVDYRQVCDE